MLQVLFTLLLESKWQKMWFINTRHHANIKFEENKRKFRSKLGNKGSYNMNDEKVSSPVIFIDPASRKSLFH